MAKDDRLRVPIDAEYLSALGLANICFARLEWEAVWCCEKISPGYIRTVHEKTAGQIAKDLLGFAEAHKNPEIVSSLVPPATEFRRLVLRRNDLVHANPGTSKDGEQRLFRRGKVWSIGDVNDLADEFVAASGPLNHHLHNVL